MNLHSSTYTYHIYRKFHDEYDIDIRRKNDYN